MNLSSSRSLRRSWSALRISRGGFWRLRILGTARPKSNGNVVNAGQLCNFSSSENDKDAEQIMFGSIPLLYKNQPLTHTATGMDLNANRCISKFASYSSSSWRAKNDSSTMAGFTNQLDEFSLPAQFGKKRKFAHVKLPNFSQSYSTGAANYNSHLSEDLQKAEGFDICLSSSESSASASSLDTRSDAIIRHIVLRPGMVLLKHFLLSEEQVETVRTCRMLGVGPLGFCPPVYKDRTKLDMQMMCLGLNWNPERLTYEYIRSVDGCEVPPIPIDLEEIASRAMVSGQWVTKRVVDLDTYEGDMLPRMHANVCIVSFYSAAASGKLGLRQDCSERRESLLKRLSVISISLGDSAEFLYGDEKDENKAKRIILESGDVLIFGGQSRHVYHGVSYVIPNTAPKELLEETRLRPGHLNLTFRQA